MALFGRQHSRDVEQLRCEMMAANPTDEIHYCAYRERRGHHLVDCRHPIARFNKYCGWHELSTNRMNEVKP